MRAESNQFDYGIVDSQVDIDHEVSYNNPSQKVKHVQLNQNSVR